ncbi:Protein of unknown function DUF3445 [Penicillium occitanis (nom. inval.)]|nr:hypothetical protein PENOC_037130 [Penicillium occitanis (nom. inval.)]PCH06866.1 Protein of unknown function DUF3445 [Penicillium occitanis (nom. inval.)]
MAIPFFDNLTAFSRENDGILDGPAIAWLQKHAIVIAALASCAVIIWYYRQIVVQGSQPLENGNLPSAVDIVPLHGFHWDETEPLAYRPFKSQYHLTMGVQQAEVSELIQIDRMYLDRIQLRKDLIARHEDQVLAVNPPAIEAVRELYSWLVDQYLPQRYGDIFELHRQESSGNIETFLQNKVTDDIVPIDPNLQSPEDALRIIGRQVEEDFLFLLPSGPEEQLVLEAYIACFPAGFAWTMKRGKTLAEIHQPVPDYKKKLQLSMDRFLSRLEPGKFVKRLNWSITPTGELFALQDLHNYGGHEEELTLENFDPSKARLRCERQTLHRLPKSRAIVFTIKTYMYPLDSIKAEGLGSQLAEAVDGLRNGSSPMMYVYKNAVSWGKVVQDYLRSESSQS